MPELVEPSTSRSRQKVMNRHGNKMKALGLLGSDEAQTQQEKENVF